MMDIAAEVAAMTNPPHATMEVTLPEQSDWRVHLMDGVVFTPKKNCEPNWFHRWMQELAFGVRWERVP